MRLEHLLSGARGPWEAPKKKFGQSKARRVLLWYMKRYKEERRRGKEAGRPASWETGKVDSPIAQLVRALH